MASKVELLLDLCREHGLKLRTAESCTAGALSASIASVSGASAVLDRGWVTYSNQAKMDELSVDAALLEAYGAVSEPMAKAMAKGGAAKHTYCIAITGIAGPSGGSDAKPVGTVWMAICDPDTLPVSKKFLFQGNRKQIQAQAVDAAIEFLYMTILNRCHTK
jgi:PncC family amidohydrolase